MPFDDDLMNTVFEGIENPKERIDKLYAEHNAEINGLKRKNEELLGKTKKTEESIAAITQEKTTLEESVKELNEKLKEGLPEQQKKHFQNEIEKREGQIKDLAAERDKKLAELSTENQTLKDQHHRYICRAEFNSLLNADASIYPELRDDLDTIFFSRNQYEATDDNGKMKLLNTLTSKTMKDDLTDFLNSPSGQHYRMERSNGGGATGSGSNGASGQKQNTVTRERFNQMSPKEQMDFVNKGGSVT
jgi:DNA repair exonuclease SbcCD ATPase subunit